MAEQAQMGKSVLQLQCSSAAQEAAERKQKNRRSSVVKAFEVSIFQNRIPHLTTYTQLVDLQVANGDQLLEQHIN